MWNIEMRGCVYVYHVLSILLQLHFVPENYVEHTRGNGILRRLKTSAIPSLQIEEIQDSENHCNPKIIRRFRQTAQCLKDITNIPIIGKEKENEHAYCLKILTCDEQVQDCLEVGNTHKGEELWLSIRWLKDEHSDVTHAMKTIDNESTSCSTPSTKHPLLTSRLTASSALLQEDMTVSVAQKDSDNDCNNQLGATTADILDNQETLYMYLYHMYLYRAILFSLISSKFSITIIIFFFTNYEYTYMLCIYVMTRLE
ncbi:uncharacterized protein LOC112456508 [Temnothorax curvispinosus]|uniref:Uncharacterized protein LOC112456508 n=1 Tax=Temnothorax curvispinosus TaxID=300111 RepID=A0A6J1Q1N4_9HYME|nr:uncharacterized protein LOC112456508 [Temnothorax curvispinosus]